MTIRTMRAWFDALVAAGVSLDEEILVDADSELEGVMFRGAITGGSMQHAHDEDDTSYGVIQVDDICDEAAENERCAK